MATPPSLPQDFKPDVAVARDVVANAVEVDEPGSIQSR